MNSNTYYPLMIGRFWPGGVPWLTQLSDHYPMPSKEYACDFYPRNKSRLRRQSA